MNKFKTGSSNLTFLEKKAGIAIPDLTLLLILSILPLFNGGMDHVATYWAFFLALAVTLLLILSNRINLNLHSTLPISLFVLLALWSGISITWSVFPHRTMVELMQLGLYGTVMFAATQLSKDGFLKIGRVMMILGVLLVIHGVLQNMLLGVTTVTSTFHHHNSFGIYMVMLFFCSWGYYMHRNTLILLIPTIFLLGLFLSGSRGALIALILSFPFFLASLPKEKQIIYNFLIKSLICLLIAFILATAIISTPQLKTSEAVEEQLSGILGRPDYLESDNIFARLTYWEVGYELIKTKPILGYGLGAFFNAYRLVDFWRDMHFSRFAHNHYLQTFVETGVIGFFLFILFILTVLVIIIKKSKQENILLIYPGVLSSLTAYLIHIGIDFSWNTPAVSTLFFSLLGLMIRPEMLSHKLNLKNNNLKYNIKPALKVFLVSTALIFFILISWFNLASIFYSRALKAEEFGYYKKAVSIFSFTNNFYPINAMAYFFTCENLLSLYEQTGEEKYLHQAQLNAEKAVKLNPFDPVIRNTLGLIYYSLGNEQAAKEQLFMGHRYSANYLPRLFNATKQYLKQENYSAAERTSLQGLEIADFVLHITTGTDAQLNMTRTAAELHLVLVELYIKQENNEYAKKHLALAYELLPEHHMFEIYNMYK